MSAYHIREKMTPHKEFYDVLETPLGSIYLIFSSSYLVGISFERPDGIPLRKSDHVSIAKRELSEYFEKGRKEFACKTFFTEGTAFEKEVWLALKEVPSGETRTYKWLADRIGKPRAFRAVGNALGKNPIPIIFPCHRIIESDGSLGGYSSGTEIKRRLLKIEYYETASK
jgi:methylated-DNA-[protein]-cysteine S-methyltransferase